ncbi:MAG: BON domain-containing protein [Planctomycetia bacterium]|nr:BON domain-containing protein [Planctomycetia bacterium]
MRRLFVPVVFALTIALGATGVRAGNQEEADKIAKLLEEKYPQYSIEVMYQDGNVRLRGDIASKKEKAEITQLIKQVPKVRTVQGNFNIQPVSDMSYQAINNSTNIRTVNAEQPVSPLYSEEIVYVDNQPMGSPIMPAAPAGGTVTRAPNDYLAPQGVPIAGGQAGQANLPNYAWPTYADYPNYSQVSYPKQYSAGTFPYIGPFYPYPQVPLGWRKVSMEWHDGYWWLDFNDSADAGPFSPLFRQPTTYR